MKTVTRYEARDGKVFDSVNHCRRHEAARDGLTHECPKCGTSGAMQGKPITERQRDYVSEGYMGQFAPRQYMDVVVGHERIPCEVCSGRGWTATPKTPVTRTEVIGYR